MAQVPFQVQAVHDFFEREVLVRQGIGYQPAGTSGQFVETGISFQPVRQGEGVYEKADERFQLLLVAVGHGRADHDPLLVAVP